MARRIYGPSYKKHILELNASDDRGIDVVREQIKSFAMTKVLFSYVPLRFDMVINRLLLASIAKVVGKASSWSFWTRQT
jgi:DNA polymerase III delta prime subunit